jgi:DNA-directed RNA polymerase subunit alpha
VTLGNPLRRALLSSLPGTAITWVKIDGVLHEYSTVEHMREEVSEFVLNVKGIRLRSLADRPGRLRLEIDGEGEVRAGDIMATADFEIVNPEHHLATLDSSKARLSVEFNVEQGVGYPPPRTTRACPSASCRLTRCSLPSVRRTSASRTPASDSVTTSSD